MNSAPDDEEDDLPLALLAEQGGSFAFLADEPDVYGSTMLVPNAETIEAMNAARNGDLVTVGDLDELLSDLQTDDWNKP